MELAEASSFVTTLRGAALSCLILMWIMRDQKRQWTQKELARFTGYDKEVTATGLSRLELHRLALRQGYSWQLTDKGYQLPGFFKELECFEKIESLGSSSSTLLIDSGACMSTHKDKEQQQLQPKCFEKIESFPESDLVFNRLTLLLVNRCGAAPARAKEVIGQALTAGENPAILISDILIWLAYCQSEQGKGSKPATLIPARIKEGIPPPEFYSPSLAVEREIQRLQAELEEGCPDVRTEL